MRRISRIRRSWMGASPQRMELVTSALTASSLVKAVPSSPRRPSQPVAGVVAGVRDDRRVGGQVPEGVVRGIEGPRAGQQQRDVIGGAVRQQGSKHRVAGLLQRPLCHAECRTHPVIA